MSGTGGGPRRYTDADLAALPPNVAAESIADTRIILPKDAALEAIAHFATQGRPLENWEGWMRLADGSRVKSLSHVGSFAMSRDAKRAADAARAGIEAAQRRWDRDPEYPNAALYFALTFAAAT